MRNEKKNMRINHGVTRSSRTSLFSSFSSSVYLRGFLILIFLVLLNSCLGAAADIVLRADGSGSIALEYRVSPMLESIGRLDGNAHQPAIPIGKTDFERTIARIPNLSIKSFSVKDHVTKVTLSFKDTAALLAFLDSSGTRASLTQTDGTTKLRLVLTDPVTTPVDEHLLSLLKEVSAGYELGISFTTPRPATLEVIPPSTPTKKLITKGKKVSFAIEMGELVALRDGLALEIIW